MSFISNVFCFIQQAYVVNMFSYYPDYSAAWFFAGTGAVSMLFFGLREFVILLNLDGAAQVVVIYGCSSLFMIIGLIIYYYLINDNYYKNIYSQLKTTEQITWKQYKTAIYIVRKEALFIFLSTGIDFLPYPGVIFSIRPASLMNESNWNTLLGLTLGVSDTLGKLLGDKKVFKYFIEKTLVLQILLNVCLITYYYSNYWRMEQYEYVSIWAVVILNLSWIRAGMAQTYYTISTKKYKNSENSLAINSVLIIVMNYGIVTGIATSSYVSLLIGYVYKWCYPNLSI